MRILIVGCIAASAIFVTGLMVFVTATSPVIGMTGFAMIFLAPCGLAALTVSIDRRAMVIRENQLNS